MPRTMHPNPWEDYRLSRQAQLERAHATGAEPGTEEHDHFMGRGEYVGGGAEHSLSSRQFMSQASKETDDAQRAHYEGEDEADEWVKANL